MSERERDRLKVLHEGGQAQLKQHERARQLGIGERGFRKLLKRYREKGDAAVVHGLRGRPSVRRLAASQAEKAVAVVKREYRDFGRSDLESATSVQRSNQDRERAEVDPLRIKNDVVFGPFHPVYFG